MTPLAHIAALPIRAYRLIFSPWVGFNCRYQPTCSAYILEALEEHGGLKGTYLGVRRVCRCHPFAASGYDPVPPAASKQSVKTPGCDCNRPDGS